MAVHANRRDEAAGYMEEKLVMETQKTEKTVSKRLSMKRRWIYIVVLSVFIPLIILAITHRIWLEAIAKFLIVADELSPADAIVVLGSGEVERLRYGVILYKSGYGKSIIITGMEIKLPGLITTWPQLAMQEAVSLGVPETAIILEERPTSTYEDAVYVRQDMLAREFSSAIIVSSPPHMRRARMIFRKVFEDQKNIFLQFSPAEDSGFESHRWWTREGELITVVNEYCKLVLYLFKYMI